MLILTRRTDEEIVIGDEITVRVLEIDENTVQLGFIAPPHVTIDREEIYRQMKALANLKQQQQE